MNIFPNTANQNNFYIGVNSGTSMDGVDVCLFDLSSQSPALIAFIKHPYPQKLKKEIKDCIFSKMTWLEREKINQQITQEFIKAIKKLLVKAKNKNNFNKNQITAIGSHGQTVFHSPENGVSIQLTNPALIAEKTGLDVVADFRQADLTVGGEGAPLAPIFHHYLFEKEIVSLQTNQSLAVVNLGGIGNVTIFKKNKHWVGYDFGPANTFLDFICQKFFNLEYDKDGKIAQSGAVNFGLLNELFEDSFFNKKYPKSTGIEYFSSNWLMNKVDLFKKNCLQANDILATLTLFLAKILVNQIDKNCIAIYLSGGGASNKFLFQLIKQEIDMQQKTAKVHLIDEKLKSEWVECGLFAYLAKAHIEKKRFNLKTVTGAKKPKILGAFYPS